MTAGARSRDSGLFLVGQLVLLFAAILWMPFGVRDSAGVSNVLPALRPAPADAPRPSTAHEHVGAGERNGVTPVRRGAVIAAALVALVLGARSRRGPLLPALTLGFPRPAIGAPVGGRAPPVLR